MEHRATLILNRLQRGARVEPGRGEDHRRAVSDTAERPEHHTKAVIHRDRDAHPVLGRQLHLQAREPGVVDDVVVAERRRLGRAGRARGELDVDRIVKLEPIGKFRHAFTCRSIASAQHIAPGHGARRAVFAEPDHPPKVRDPLGAQLTWRGIAEFRQQLLEHRRIVAGLEARHGDQRAGLHLVQCKLQFRQAVGGIDVDQDQPRLRGGELGHDPFGHVRRPDADSVAGLEPKRHKTRGQLVHFCPEFAPAPSHALMGNDQRICVPAVRDRLVEQLAHGQPQ